MRRMLLVLTAAALTAMMMVASAAPAMARDLDDVNFGVFGFDDDIDFFGDGDFDVDNEAESGDVDISFGVSNEGDFAMQCTPALQFGNTGNFNNAPAFLQFGSGGFVDDFGFFGEDFDDFGFFGNGFDGGIDDFEPGGIDVTFAPSLAADCDQAVQQSSAASS